MVKQKRPMSAAQLLLYLVGQYEQKYIMDPAAMIAAGSGAAETLVLSAMYCGPGQEAIDRVAEVVLQYEPNGPQFLWEHRSFLENASPAFCEKVFGAFLAKAKSIQDVLSFADGVLERTLDWYEVEALRDRFSAIESELALLERYVEEEKITPPDDPILQALKEVREHYTGENEIPAEVVRVWTPRPTIKLPDSTK